MSKVNTTKITKSFKPAVLAYTAASNTTAGAAEEFTFELPRRDFETFIIIKNPTIINGSALKVEFKTGDFWAAKGFGSESYTITAGSEAVISIESAYIKKQNGEAVLTLTPVTTSVNLAATGAQLAIAAVCKTANN